MSDKNEVCKHGHWARQCEICEAIQERDEAMEYEWRAKIGTRDQFAMAALTGLNANPSSYISADTIADWAYDIADAMMARRKRKK